MAKAKTKQVVQEVVKSKQSKTGPKLDTKQTLSLKLGLIRAKRNS